MKFPFDGQFWVKKAMTDIGMGFVLSHLTKTPPYGAVQNSPILGKK